MRELDGLTALSERAYLEFNDVADYVWKALRIVEYETALEKDKLKDYLADKELADLRWKHEARKLTSVFPYLIAVGNLFSVLSLFETYLLLLCSELEKRSGVPISSARGQGLARCYDYLKLIRIDQRRAPFHEELKWAIKVRNCLVHASGLLSWSRESRALEHMVTTTAYLSQEHRARRLELKAPFDEVRISDESTPLGARLVIHNKYSWLVAAYARDHVVGLCSLGQSLEG